MSVDQPIVQLAILTLAAGVARRMLLPATPSPIAAGAIVMAAGIFGLASFEAIALLPAGAIRFFTLALLVIWGFIAASHLVRALQGRLAAEVAAPMDGLAVGTWVAGTAVMARIVLLGVPDWRGAALLLSFIALAVWLWYLRLVWRGFRAVLASPARLRVTGRILLSTVATQSLVLLAWHLWPGADWLRVPATVLIVLGYLFYLGGLVLIVQRYLREAHWTLADDWDNTNCILHGAMSISGLAVAYTGVLPQSLGVATWVYVLIMLIGVEAVEILRLCLRLRRQGLRQGLLTYHVTQWSRNFTFGMFYAMTLALQPAFPSFPALSPLKSFIGECIAWGLYLVLFFLLVEAGLWLAAHAGQGSRKNTFANNPIVNEYAKEHRP